MVPIDVHSLPLAPFLSLPLSLPACISPLPLLSISLSFKSALVPPSLPSVLSLSLFSPCPAVSVSPFLPLSRSPPLPSVCQAFPSALTLPCIPLPLFSSSLLCPFLPPSPTFCLLPLFPICLRHSHQFPNRGGISETVAGISCDICLSRLCHWPQRYVQDEAGPNLRAKTA